MVGESLKKYLDDNRVKYVTIKHSPAFTAMEVAAAAHVPGKELAKTVIVKLDGRMAMAVLPASHRIVFDMLTQATGVRRAELTDEREFAALFPECEPGAMPPFGNLYGMDVLVADTLAEDEEIAFNACSHSELVRMPYKEFARLAQPKVLKFTAKV
jgi:Ala-tRNA(Pro) deacylase